MASTTINLTETFPLDDILVETHLVRTFSLEDNLTLVDTLVETHTIRTTKNLEDGLGLVDTIGVIEQNQFTVNFDDVLLLGEEFSESHTARTIITLEDSSLLSDDIAAFTNNRWDVDLLDALALADTIEIIGTNRFVRDINDTLLIGEVLLQEFGIRMDENEGGVGFVNGLSFASLQAGVDANLTVTIPFNHIFFKWLFNKSGIDNIYNPTATLTVPAGGGVIKPSFIDLGTIEVPFGSVLTVVDPNDLEYIDDPDGDYISTTETAEAVGDAVSVAKKNLTIEQGSTFFNIVIYRDVDGNPVDLTGYTAAMQIRKTKDSSTILLTLNTSNGYLILGGALGTVTIGIPADITAALDFVWGRYDLELYPGGDTTAAVRLLEGKINLSKEVTQ